MEGLRGDETQIERRRRGRDHEERVLHRHEEEEAEAEQARNPMVRGDVDRVGDGPFHEGGLSVVVHG